MLPIDSMLSMLSILHPLDVVEVGSADLGAMQVYIDVRLAVLDRFDVDFANDLALCLADVVVLDVVNPFYTFDVAESLVVDGLGDMQVSENVQLDVLDHFVVRFANGLALYSFDVAAVIVLVPFHLFDVVAVLILDDLGWKQVHVEDRLDDDFAVGSLLKSYLLLSMLMLRLLLSIFGCQTL